ncbi:hydrogenase maturation protease [Hydrogenophaga sp. H7]|jgi:hydrogenase maturation protease|uniref:hydrogenase maturation protease n=1 Tax=Hydrogenophaga sp. H7 TaxID=1882399 RepID=UPI0009A42080|nr:hydrogenase maturation protease [Hydrogenophaga sp. H7]OPF63015.1 Ni/Fe hydrogenase [Hydrogenophaga sp. H7]
MNEPVAPLLVLAWGNPSRGDDALGPMLAERLLAQAEAASLAGRVEVLTDFQLQVEHALDLVGRERVLFVDAALDLAEPFTVRPLQAARGGGIGSHALAPEAVLQVYEDLHGHAPPASTLLAIRASAFELGAAPSVQALKDLDQAVAWVCRWLTGELVTEEVPA